MSAASTPAPATTGEIEAALARLAEGKNEWLRCGVGERVDLLRRCSDGVLRVADEWVRLACQAKGIDPSSPLAGEEWLSGPMITVRALRLLRQALEHDGRPVPPAIRAATGGQQIATVLPANVFDRVLFSGVRAEVWIEPGEPASQGRIYREKAAGQGGAGRVALVLGAGNVASIPPTDLLHKLFVEDQVVVLKMSPINGYLGPLLARAFRCLVEKGLLEVVQGGREAGSLLCAHPDVDTIHLTGAASTYDAIVWGENEDERKRRKAAGQPRIDKPVTAELGCVTPVLVVPGSWSASDIDFQARHLAAMVAHNASFNCNAAQLLVTARGWPQRRQLLDRLEQVLGVTPPRLAYYPGAEQRYRAFLERYPGARQLGHGAEGHLPWTLIPEVPAASGEYALNNEAFCSVLAEVPLDAADADFLERAVDFVNADVWGTLSCTMLIDPATRRRHAAGVERAIARLRYGGIGVNAWAAVNFALGVTSWGAFPGHTAADIGSGIGTVHNSFLFDHPQKSVVQAPFRARPKPVWFTDHRTLSDVGRKMTRFEACPSWRALPALVLSALRG